MEDTDQYSAPFARIVVAVAIASLLSLLAYPVGVYAEAVVGNGLSGSLVNQSPQFAFLSVIFSGEGVFVIEPWESVIVGIIAPFLLFFWLSGWAGINIYEDLPPVAIQAFGWGVLLSLVGPQLGDYPLNNGTFLGFRTAILSTISNPGADLGLVAGGISVAMVAVAGTSFGYFWRQTHYRTLRGWFEKHDDSDEEEPTQEVQPPPDTGPSHQPGA